LPKINIDDAVKPIEITVGGKNYIVEDISRDIMTKMSKMARKAQLAEDAAKIAINAGKEPEEDQSITEMANIMAEIMGAEPNDIVKLGMRKLNTLITRFMQTLNEELEGKNVPKAEAMKSPK